MATLESKHSCSFRILMKWCLKCLNYIPVYPFLIFDIFASGLSQSFSNRRDKSLSKLTKLAVNSRRFDVRAPDSPAGVSNQVNVFLHQESFIHMVYLPVKQTR